jgi:hypothetical protein
VLGLLVLPIDRRSRFRFHSEVEVNQTGDKYREIAVFGRRCHSHILLVVQNSSDETELRLLIDLVCRLLFFICLLFLIRSTEFQAAHMVAEYTGTAANWVARKVPAHSFVLVVFSLHGSSHMHGVYPSQTATP